MHIPNYFSTTNITITRALDYPWHITGHTTTTTIMQKNGLINPFGNIIWYQTGSSQKYRTPLNITEAIEQRSFTFCLPGNLNLALLKASTTDACWGSLVRTDIIGCPMFTLATVPCGLPHAPRIPVWSLKICKLIDKVIPLINWFQCIMNWQWKYGMTCGKGSV